METDRETAVKGTTEQETTEDKGVGTREDSIRREYGFASDVKLKECRFCRVLIPKKAKVCPNCRMNLKRHWFRNLAAAVFAVAVIGVGGYYLSGHWGIMQDAVMSVWMAQKGTAVPAVSVITVDTEEVASGAAMAEPSETVAASGSNETAEPEEAGEIQAAKEKTTTELPETEERQEAEPVEAAEAQEAEPEEAEAAASETIREVQEAAPEEEAEEQTNTLDDGTSSGVNRSDSAQENLEESQESGSTVSRQDHDKLIAPEEQAFRDTCIEAGYKSLLRDAESYLDSALKVEAEVVCQVNGGLFDENIYYLCMQEEKNNVKRYYIIRDDRDMDDTLILEGDMLTVYGRLFGSCRIPANLIETRPTVPAVSMLYYDLTEE